MKSGWIGLLRFAEPVRAGLLSEDSPKRIECRLPLCICCVMVCRLEDHGVSANQRDLFGSKKRAKGIHQLPDIADGILQREADAQGGVDVSLRDARRR